MHKPAELDKVHFLSGIGVLRSDKGLDGIQLQGESVILPNGLLEICCPLNYDFLLVPPVQIWQEKQTYAEADHSFFLWMQFGRVCRLSSVPVVIAVNPGNSHAKQ
jgi:hypothetical protein